MQTGEAGGPRAAPSGPHVQRPRARAERRAPGERWLPAPSPGTEDHRHPQEVTGGRGRAAQRPGRRTVGSESARSLPVCTRPGGSASPRGGGPCSPPQPPPGHTPRPGGHSPRCRPAGAPRSASAREGTAAPSRAQPRCPSRPRPLSLAPPRPEPACTGTSPPPPPAPVPGHSFVPTPHRQRCPAGVQWGPSPGPPR